MNTKTLISVITRMATVSMILIVTGVTYASVIDTRPSNSSVYGEYSSGPDVVGGVFTADDTNLASFTLDILLAPGEKFQFSGR